MGRKKTIQDKLVLTRVPSTSSIITRRSKSEQQTESANRVFNNPLLMDKIMKYSVYKSNGKEIDTKAVVAIRLVNKTWLQSVSHTLKISGDYVISIEIGGVYTVNRRPSGVFLDKKEAILDNFVSVFSTSSQSIDSILPIHFDILQHFLVKDNCKKLSDFFEQFGNIISSLSVTYPLDGDLLNFKCNNLCFPILKTVDFGFEVLRCPLTNLRMDAAYENNSNGFSFLQQILQNSPNLQSFIFNRNDLKRKLKTCSISLPAALKMLRLGSPLTEIDLTLTNNPLPNLNYLDLEINRTPEVPLAYKILERFGPQLTNLFMTVVSYHDESRIIVKFPSMEKLTYLKLSGEDYALSPQLRNVWPTLVPNLTRLVFKEELPESIFLDWVQGSRFENVQKLKFSLNCKDGDFYDMISPSVQIIKEIIASFPNIQKLTLSYVLSDISSLKYLFRNLPNLLKLSLNFDDSKRSPRDYELVSIFLGISIELATALVDKTVRKVNIAVDNPESIMNLTELSSLTVRAPPQYLYLLERCQNTSHSGIIYKHGLEKMPKLQNIKLLSGVEQ